MRSDVKYFPTQAHCIICGFSTWAFQRPNPCPACGALNCWGSVFAPFPKPEQARLARERYARRDNGRGDEEPRMD